MLDPISAVSFTASLLQIVTFSQSLIETSSDVYRSVKGETVQATELQAIVRSYEAMLMRIGTDAINLEAGKAREYRQACERGTRKSEPPSQAGGSFPDRDIEKLASKARVVVKEIIELLGKVRGDPSTHNRWKSVRVAFLTIVNETRLNGLTQRLGELRSQIDSSMISSIWHALPQTKEQHDQDLVELRGDVEKLSVNTESHTATLDRLIQHVADSGESRDYHRGSPSFTDLLQVDNERLRISVAHDRFIESLSFDAMPQRQEDIPQAYQRTFEWVYTNQYDTVLPNADPDSVEDGKFSHSSFKAWLEAPDSLFWITGKPGAGKSTLMKFVFQTIKAQQTIDCSAIELSRPARVRIKGTNLSSLSTAAYFFWSPGSSMQKSKIGLCHTIIYNLLKTMITSSRAVASKLIEASFPGRWHRHLLYGNDRRPFSWSELWTGLLAVLSNPGSQFLLFVDGLDEMEGNTSELVDLILELAALPSVKICVASRPWVEFHDAFRHAPQLRLEELTWSDIGHYTQGRLASSPAFEMLLRYDKNRAQTIIQNVIDRASGVFLWVYVVVESLLEGLRNGDSFTQLEQRFDELPTELDDLFSNILKQVPPDYAEEASRYFQYVRAHAGQVSLLAIYFAHETMEDALSEPITRLWDEELEYPLDAMRRRIYSRCKCLLQVNTPCSKASKVQYLHRTVRDYMSRPEYWEDIKRRSPTYDSNYAWAIAALRLAKIRPDGFEVTMALRQDWQDNLFLAIDYVAAATPPPTGQKVDFLDQVQIIANAFRHSLIRSGNSDSGPSSFDGGISAAISSTTLLDRTVFQAALELDLDWYIDAKLTQDAKFLTTRLKGEYPLLLCVKQDLWRVSIKLLHHGADPNYQPGNGDLSPWLVALSKVPIVLAKAESENTVRQVVAFLCLCLEKKAAPRKSCKGAKPSRLIEQATSALRSMSYLEESRTLDQKFDEALKGDKSTRRSVFKKMKP